MNAKMIEAGLGMLARFIPPEEYAKAVKAINDLAVIAKTFDDRLARVERLLIEQGEQVRDLQTIVNISAPGAAHEFYAEKRGWQVGGRIEQALAPAREGSLNDH